MTEGRPQMTDNRTELLKLLLEHDNVEQAIITASAIIRECLMRHESSEPQPSVPLEVTCQTRAS